MLFLGLVAIAFLGPFIVAHLLARSVRAGRMRRPTAFWLSAFSGAVAISPIALLLMARAYASLWLLAVAAILGAAFAVALIGIALRLRRS